MHARQDLVEHLLRGAFLGAAVVMTLYAQGFREIVAFFLFAFLPAIIGVLIGLVVRTEHRKSLFTAFAPRLLLGVIDSPRWIHTATLAGSLAASLYLQWPTIPLVIAVSVGTVLSALVYSLHQIRNRSTRRWISVSLLAVSVASTMYLAGNGWFQPTASPLATSLAILLTAFLLYWLTFAGRSEQSEFDIALVCLGLCLSLAALDAPRTVRSLVVLLPLTIFFLYCERIRKRLVVFKHAIRGMEHERSGRLSDALVTYRLALDVDPTSELATEGSWRIHHRVNVTDLADDVRLRQMIDPLVCLKRAQSLLAKSSDPKFAAEATKLLDIIEVRDLDLRRSAGRLRIEFLLAQNQIDEAIDHATNLAFDVPDDLESLGSQEADALFAVWTMLLREPVLAASGAKLLDDKEGLLVFLAILESHRKRHPKDELAHDFRPFLYRKLRLSDVERAVSLASPRLNAIDWQYLRKIASEVAAEPGRSSSAIELLKIAEIGLPNERLAIWLELAHLHESQDPADAAEWYERIFQHGTQRNIEALSEPDRDALFAAATFLATRAEQRNQTDHAIRAWSVYSNSPRAGVQTHRKLQKLFEEKNDRLSAIRHIHAALAYQLNDEDKRSTLLERNRLYSEITPEEVQSRSKEAAAFFSTTFCLRTAEKLFDQKAAESEILHYLDLASAVGSDSLLDINFLLGRLHLREGRDQDAADCFQAVADDRPKHFRDKDQERCYFRACRTLGELLVDRLDQPDKAVPYLHAFKDHLDSGADTLFLLARAYEACGKIAQARKWYDMVLVYPSHPRAPAAKEALARLEKK